MSEHTGAWRLLPAGSRRRNKNESGCLTVIHVVVKLTSIDMLEVEMWVRRCEGEAERKKRRAREVERYRGEAEEGVMDVYV